MHKWHGYWKREEPIGSNKVPHQLLVVATIVAVALDLGDVVVDVDDMKKNGIYITAIIFVHTYNKLYTLNGYSIVHE